MAKEKEDVKALLDVAHEMSKEFIPDMMSNMDDIHKDVNNKAISVDKDNAEALTVFTMVNIAEHQLVIALAGMPRDVVREYLQKFEGHISGIYESARSQLEKLARENG